jgi:hypothetical protein
MKFKPKSPGAFEPVPDQPGILMYRTPAGTQGRPLAFLVSGSGKLPAHESEKRNAQAVNSVEGRAVRLETGSGLQTLRAMRWFMWGGFVLVLAASAAGFLFHKRRASADMSD